eukprot:GHVU01209958.1.p1 GENE.GHVU01209958.1~~GHVU01209958.1.p1  ORF type:complete len:124 (+),score=19.13 GHVU01209958.1:430-801(+)
MMSGTAAAAGSTGGATSSTGAGIFNATASGASSGQTSGSAAPFVFEGSNFGGGSSSSQGGFGSSAQPPAGGLFQGRQTSTSNTPFGLGSQQGFDSQPSNSGGAASASSDNLFTNASRFTSKVA